MCKVLTEWMGEQDITQLAFTIMCDFSTGCDEVDGNIATVADIMIYIVHEDNLDKFKYLHLTVAFTKVTCLNVTELFSVLRLYIL